MSSGDKLKRTPRQFIAGLAATWLFALAALGTLTPSTTLALLGVWVALCLYFAEVSLIMRL
ncbi:MAG TPA: hypothetical protein VK638_14315 [Edaphobacter sp.]|nr:hypothetical protein [Edaphobacter sp.]